MDVVTKIAAVRERVQGWRADAERIAFVPTMGNLHAGHLSLIEAAGHLGSKFIASIFVNPMQFGPNEDFAHYPRTVDADFEMLSKAGCSVMFMPDAKEIYPDGVEHATQVVVPELTKILCGAFRPGHFEGVATVVAKLFNIVQPDVAVFGEKDYQQLAIIRRMTTDLCMPIEIVGAPTVREKDGLAMSSRNQYLTEEERKIAPKIYQALQRAAERLRFGVRNVADAEGEGTEALKAGGITPDYFSVRDAVSLGVPTDSSREVVVLTAARLGKARLIDNIKVRFP